MSHFNALGRRGLVQGSAATALGAVVVPAGRRAEAAVPQPIAANLVTAIAPPLERPRLPGARADRR